MRGRGRPRLYTDAQLAALRAWKPGGRRTFWQHCMDVGISSREAGNVLRKYQHKTPSP